jgi:hypothetical protein
VANQQVNDERRTNWECAFDNTHDLTG